MRKIIMGLASLTMAAAGIALRPRDAQADYGIIHGCWFYSGQTPGCNICADNCNPYQNCCIILHL